MGGNGALGGADPQSERFFEAFAKSCSIEFPSSPPRDRREPFWERLIDELGVELFVNPPNIKFPSLPPRLTNGLHCAKRTRAISTPIINIIRLIPFPVSGMRCININTLCFGKMEISADIFVCFAFSNKPLQRPQSMPARVCRQGTHQELRCPHADIRNCDISRPSCLLS